MKIGLVLEGGGLRASYTIGALDCLMDKKIDTDYCIGVSAGACHGVSYVSKQRGRSRRVNSTYASDPRYIGIGNLIKTKSIFGMKFIFDTIPNELVPFDYDAFFLNPCEFVVGVTDVYTGNPVYFTKEALNSNSTVLMASSSLPIVGVPIPFRDGLYMDGGISDPIPLSKALADGCDKVIVVLTRDRDYIKPPEGKTAVYKHIFHKYPEMQRALAARYTEYAKSQQLVRSLEQDGKAFVLAPTSPINVGRFETNPKKLDELFNRGYLETLEQLDKIKAFIQK